MTEPIVLVCLVVALVLVIRGLRDRELLRALWRETCPHPVRWRSGTRCVKCGKDVGPC